MHLLHQKITVKSQLRLLRLERRRVVAGVARRHAGHGRRRRKTLASRSVVDASLGRPEGDEPPLPVLLTARPEVHVLKV